MVPMDSQNARQIAERNRNRIDGVGEQGGGNFAPHEAALTITDPMLDVLARHRETLNDTARAAVLSVVRSMLKRG